MRTERSLARSGTPGCSHTAASAAKPQIAATIPSTRPADRSPCSKLRSVCVSDRRDTHSSTPGCPASAKSSTQEPMVKASVTMAAVAELSEMLAAEQRNGADQQAVEQMTEQKVEGLRDIEVAAEHQPRSPAAEAAGMTATSQAPKIAAILAAISVGTRYGNCTSRRSAPVSFSRPSVRMATNGNSSVTAT